ncbi:hypothetical protein [Flavobacterium sp. CF136]|uniref:hypothetical protein n=1 Tax=Flavobacterium sp. (strain CF136) TaxID=1144313 RepID=UPI000271D1E2|nr:hypothetical protein [Flavobacterium sp. CF136]EJL66114.1 hypothetical protein PMI10_00864 [Flavobacterium sp. CF136]
MKKKYLLLFLQVLICFSCSDNESLKQETNAEEVQHIAKEHHFKFSNSDSETPIFKVSTTIELKKILTQYEKTLKTVKIKNINSSLISKDNNAISELITNTYNSYKNQQKTNKTSGSNEEDPPYKYSTTVYFDNTFPASNVYIRIDYNTNSAGQITEVSVSSGSYGYALGNTYTQTGVNTYTQNGVLAFQVSGQFSSSIGIGSFSMTNSNNITYTGFISIPSGNGGSNPTGWIRQVPEQLPPGESEEPGKEND